MVSSPLLVLDAQSPLAPYEQIEAQLRAWIAAGRLRPGAALPSVRQLARDLGIAPNTVVRAYDGLEQGGWVVASFRRGIAVAPHVPRTADEERARQIDDAVTRLLVTVHHLEVTPADLHAAIDRHLP